MAESTEQPSGESPLSRVPRRPSSNEPPAPDLSQQTQLAKLVDSVKVLADQLNANPASDGADNASDRAARRAKKFQRRGVTDDRRPDGAADTVPAYPTAEDAPPADEIALPEASTAADPAALNKNIAWPSHAGGRPARPGLRTPRKKRSTMIPTLVLLGCNLAVLILGYWFGQAAAGSASLKDGTPTPVSPNTLAVDTLAPRTVGDQATSTADAAIKAEKAGDVATAQRAYDAAIQQHLSLPGAEYRLALLAVRRGDLLDADLHLVHSTNAGEFVAACYYVRATFAGAKGNYAEAARQLEAAAHAEPFSAKYHFYWGESLRRQGKPHAAVTCLEQTLDRPYTPEEGDLYLFKLGLAKVELGDDDAFNKWLADHLQQPIVAGDTLLLAAAQALQRPDFGAAATYLEKAKSTMTPELFNARVRDYLFQMHVAEPQVAPYLDHPLAAPVSAAGTSAMDPASWSPEKGDPGAWPNAGAAGH